MGMEGVEKMGWIFWGMGGNAGVVGWGAAWE
jgi:hypothetical protein